ncbi:MAG TPA: endonuclease/exonuclease/phosphatase family protein, partial [Candidatus Hydrogenedentes bacterium]|nr:endonuclease/exonuclease/phosphatase family protein [Candidatus Hydrogenedentota bacterium]
MRNLRFLLYNIRYATGTGPVYHFPAPFSGSLRMPRGHLDRIALFLREEAPDLIGLVEVDSGSRRAGHRNQAEHLALRVETPFFFHANKYGESSPARRLPYFRNQGNAVLSSLPPGQTRALFFNTGMKRLILEIGFDPFDLLLVHLALGNRTRKRQLDQLTEILRGREKPLILAGDFNTFGGWKELEPYAETWGVVSANQRHHPTFPSRNPQVELDYILHSPEITCLRCSVPRIRLSD